MLKQYFENVETQYFFHIFFSSAGNSARAPAGPHSSAKAGGAWSFIGPTGGGAPARGKARQVGRGAAAQEQAAGAGEAAQKQVAGWRRRSGARGHGRRASAGQPEARRGARGWAVAAGGLG